MLVNARKLFIIPLMYVFKLNWTVSVKSLRSISDYKFINFC